MKQSVIKSHKSESEIEQYTKGEQIHWWDSDQAYSSRNPLH